jgi:pentatricopeptide repeat protein
MGRGGAKLSAMAAKKAAKRAERDGSAGIPSPHDPKASKAPVASRAAVSPVKKEQHVLPGIKKEHHTAAAKHATVSPSIMKEQHADRQQKGFFKAKRAQLEKEQGGGVKEGATKSPKHPGEAAASQRTDGTPFQKKLRPSLQKLRIAGGVSRDAASKKRPHADAGLDKAGGERDSKKQKHDKEGKHQKKEKHGKKDKTDKKSKKGKKGKKGPKPVASDEKAREGNNEIAQFANRKMLKEAEQCFENAIRKNLANSHTYTIMINAHVRCGDADGAAKVLKRMAKASLQPCVVAYTTLINGKCRAGDLPGGMEVLRAMLERRPPVLPNVRTVNTLLRG